MDDKHNKCEGCMHGFCGGGHGALRWVLGFIILIVIFMVGVRVGELKSEIYGGYGMSGYGYPMMGGGMNRMYYSPQVMMGGWTTATAVPQAPTVLKTPTTTK